MNAKRILILGPESTGKSTLAKDLSESFEEPWVPEYVREYMLNLDREYVFEDLSTIAKGQLVSEDEQYKYAKKFLFCDTDLRVIHIWSEFKFGKTAPWILAEIDRRAYDFIFLCGIDIKWEPDPLREHPEPNSRQELFDRYLDLVKNSEIPFQVLHGSRAERLGEAIHILNKKFVSHDI